MTELEIIAVMCICWIQGVVIGYILWAPESSFKQGFIDGLTLRFLWRSRNNQ